VTQGRNAIGVPSAGLSLGWVLASYSGPRKLDHRLS
jgi:hypothetical protein